MRPRILLLAAVAATTLSMGIAFPPEADAKTWKYQMIDLGAPDGSWATAINTRGQIIGGFVIPPETEDDFEVFRGFIWDDGLIMDLGTTGGPDTVAQAINERGQVVGTSTPHPACELAFFEVCSRAFLWQDGFMIDLGDLGGSASVATAINNRGQVVGMTTTADCDFLFMDECERAFLWEKGQMTDLGTLGGAARPTDDIAKAWAINDRGQIVGSSGTTPREDGDTRSHAFLWEHGLMTDLGTLGGDFSEALALNNRGDIVGWSATEELPRSDFLANAVLWRRGRITDLASAADGARATAINQRGQIIGRHGRRAFIWDNGVMTDLGDLGGDFFFTITHAAAINNKGQVVGWSATPSGNFHAFVWEKGVMTDLGAPAEGWWTLAEDINDRGEIVGRTLPAFAHDQSRAVLWTKTGPPAAPPGLARR